MNATQASAQRPNVLSFQPKQEVFPYEHYQTASERQVYSKMYQQTKCGQESRRFTLDGLKYATGIKSQETVRVALAGLVRKKHVTILDKKGCRHYGILYRIQMPHEIRALNQDPAYLAEQEQLAEEVKQKKANQKAKAKQQKLQFEPPPGEPGEPPDQPTDEEPQTPPASMAMPATTAAPGATVEPLAEAANPSEKSAIRVTESAEIAEPKNSKIRVTETQKLGSQKARILFMLLTWVIHEKHRGGVDYSARMHAREVAPGEIETSSAAPEPAAPSVPSRPVRTAAKKAEADKSYCNSKTTVAPENTDLGQALCVMLQWTDIVLDGYLRGKLRHGIAWFSANHATPEEILRYKVWWWESGRTRPPKLDWMIENFPVFRGEIAAPQATGTAARPAGQGNHSAPIKLPTKAFYETIAAQMSQVYTGTQWESISEKMAVFKGYVLRAGLAWNDDLANEIFCS
jgi:hypothetical protein